MRRELEGLLGGHTMADGGSGAGRQAGRKSSARLRFSLPGLRGSSDRDGIGVADVVLRCCCAGWDAVVSVGQKGRGVEQARSWVDVEVQRLHGTGVCSLPAGLDRSQGRPDLDEAAAGAGAQRRWERRQRWVLSWVCGRRVQVQDWLAMLREAKGRGPGVEKERG